MHPSLLLLSFVFVVFSVSDQAAAETETGATKTNSAPLGEAIDAYMQERLRLGHFSGTVLAAQGGQVLLSRAYGYSDFKERTPLHTGAQFRVASLTKQFTAALVLQLRDEGVLKLADSICEFEAPCPAHWRDVTIEMLLNHTSGIPDYESALGLGSKDYVDFMRRPDHVHQIVDDARGKPLHFPAGTSFSYSNTGYVLLARIAERASNKPFGALLAARIFDKAGMSESAFDRHGAIQALSTGHTDGGTEIPIERSVAGVALHDRGAVAVPAYSLAGPHGDAGLVTTAQDLYKWEKALNSETILRRATFTEALTQKAGSYGFGWSVDSRFGQTLQYHDGVLPGYVARIERIPESDFFLALLSNFDAINISRIARDVSAIALGRPYDLPRPRRIVRLDINGYKQLEGVYDFQGQEAQVAYSVERKMLNFGVGGRFSAGLLPESTTQFYSPFFDGTVKFDLARGGMARALTLRTNGTDIVCPRMHAPQPSPKSR